MKLTLLDSAQCFQWELFSEGWYGAVLRGEPVFIRQEKSRVEILSIHAEDVRQYLDLNRNYNALLEDLLDHPICAYAVQSYSGLRLLRQDPWDALFMFILSANNNVKRIRKLTHTLSCKYGREYSTSLGTLHALPDSASLARSKEEELRAMGVGYRAPYLISTARMVEDGFPLYALAAMPYEEAHAHLCRLPGVGDKVADCVLLFGCEHDEAFPVDVWVARMLESCFAIRGGSRAKIAAMARARFGALGGLMQQFLFHAARTEGVERLSSLNF